MLQRLALAAFCAATFAAALAIPPALAQRPAFTGPALSGYLCCNMRSYGNSVSDINYDEAAQRLPLGAPVQVTAYDYRWFDAVVDGKVQRFKNDYSRDVKMADFAQRYVVAEDPRLKLAGWAPAVREAVVAGRLLPGMTREQVRMALGWPVSSENPQPDAPVWRYWTDSFSEYVVAFDAEGKVRKVSGAPAAVERVWVAP